MSGKDGSTHNNTGGGGDPSTCETLIVNTQLTSPKAAVVKLLQEGDELSVALDTQRGRSVIVALHDGNEAGGLTAPEVRGLRACIEAGFVYSATVLGISEGQVRVRVHCAS